MGLMDNFRKGQELARNGKGLQEGMNQAINEEPTKRVIAEPGRTEDKSQFIAVDTHKIQSVRIVDFDMPFGSMVSIMVKWALATIPAIIILSVISFGCYVAFLYFAKGFSNQ